jgi:RNA polymerase sigma-B factor
MISNERANELFREYRKTGDIKIRNELVENYMYVAEILAKKFAGRGVEYDDLLQVASEALIAGVQKFDPDMGNQFTTYITPTITGIIRNYFRDYSRSIRVPRRIYAMTARIKNEINEYYKEHGVKPTVKQLSEILDIPEEEIIETMESHAPVSLDTTVKGDESDVPLYEVIADDSDTFENLEDREALKTEIAKLDDIEKKLMSLRFIHGKSQAEAGKILGVSQMFVSRSERRIIEKLKEALLK